MNPARIAALRTWTTTEIVTRLAGDRKTGLSNGHRIAPIADAELARAIEVELVSRVGISAAMDLIDAEFEIMDAEHQAQVFESMWIASELERGKTLEAAQASLRLVLQDDDVAA
jgi:hypothetical protein